MKHRLSIRFDPLDLSVMVTKLNSNKTFIFYYSTSRLEILMWSVILQCYYLLPIEALLPTNAGVLCTDKTYCVHVSKKLSYEGGILVFSLS